MVGAKFGFRELECLFGERQGQIRLPGIRIHLGEIDHSAQRARMIGAEIGFPELERVLEERQGAVILSRSAVASQAVLRPQSLLCFRAEYLAVQFDASLQERNRPKVFPKGAIGDTNNPIEFCLSAGARFLRTFSFSAARSSSSRSVALRVSSSPPNRP